MRLCRFNEDRIGVVRDEGVFDVTPVLDALPSFRFPLPRYDVLIANLQNIREKIAKFADSAAMPMAIDKVKLLSPVANPGKIIAAPVNYKKHLDEARDDPQISFQRQVAEIGKAGLFLKATSSAVGPGEGVAIRFPDRRNDHEVELAVVIGKPADRVSAREALDYVAGYCIGLDMTVRGTEDRSFRKSLDTFTVLGPWLVTGDELTDPGNVSLSLKVNDELRQNSNTRELVVGVSELISWASSFYTLLPGDVLLTGTPEGVGPVKPGDVIHAFVDGVGAMDVHVRAAEAPSRHRG